MLILRHLLPGTLGLLLAGSSVALAPAPTDGQVSVLSAEQVIEILDDTVDWYRTLGTQQQAASQPSDLLILFANRQTANQVVALAFDIARANAELLSSEANAAAPAAGSDASALDSFEQEHTQVELQVESVQQDIKQQSAKQASPLQGELAMLEARKNLLDTMADFVNENNPKGASANALKAQIDAIAGTVPQLAVPGAPPVAALGTPATATANAAPSAENKLVTTRTSIWDLASAALNLKRKLKIIEVIDQHTAALAQTFSDFSAPSLKQLKSYSARSDALASQARGADGATQKTLRGQFDTLAWLFKQTSDILLPLDKERVLLEQYRHNLANWRTAVRGQFTDAMLALSVRLAILAAILAAVFVAAEIWKRAVLRYSHEPRRRGQLLLIQRIVLWLSVFCIIGVSFATELSTFATFAGLLTAGVAVAMQSVLVSVVGYFFLIGKYGIRVGDRIQIGSVSGEVIDIGLVRMHLLELNSNGPLGPTGRVVAFANLIVFQASGGLFKQIPGVNLSWHESTINLPVVGNYAALKDSLQAAVAAVLVKYEGELSRQSREIERTTSTTATHDSTAFVQLHLLDGRMVAVIRYPVHLEDAVEIDEQVAEAVLKIIDNKTADGSG